MRADKQGIDTYAVGGWPAEEQQLDPPQLAAILHRSLHALDRMERDSTGDRLAVVADLVANSARLPGWSAFSDSAGVLPRMVLRHMLRPVTVPDERFDVRLGPVVDGFGLHATLQSGPQALRRRLEASRLLEVLVVGGYAPDATRWVLECYRDDQGPGLQQLLPTVYAVVQAALSFPRAAQQVRLGPTGHRSLDPSAHLEADSPRCLQ